LFLKDNIEIDALIGTMKLGKSAAEERDVLPHHM
jgi:hypothetical protein